MSNYIAIVKLGYVPVVNADDEVIPGNVGALRFGLEALQSEDNKDLVRSRELWEMAKKELADESEDDTGAGASGVINMADDFNMAALPMEGDSYYG